VPGLSSSLAQRLESRDKDLQITFAAVSWYQPGGGIRGVNLDQLVVLPWTDPGTPQCTFPLVPDKGPTALYKILFLLQVASLQILPLEPKYMFWNNINQACCFPLYQ
jgi:hypothetical protein